MRLWHQELISKLPRQQLLGQHRECCALRGKGWGKKHSVVNYVFEYDPGVLVAYHYLIMNEMKRRGYHPDDIWENPNWRGAALGEVKNWVNEETFVRVYNLANTSGFTIYPEHNDNYMCECIENLKGKGIDING